MLRMSQKEFNNYQQFANDVFKYFNKKIINCTANALIRSNVENPFTGRPIDYKDLIIIDLISILRNHEHKTTKYKKTRMIFSICKEVMYKGVIIDQQRYFSEGDYAKEIDLRVKYLTYRFLIDNHKSISAILYSQDLNFIKEQFDKFVRKNKEDLHFIHKTEE